MKDSQLENDQLSGSSEDEYPDSEEVELFESQEHRSHLIKSLWRYMDKPIPNLYDEEK